MRARRTVGHDPPVDLTTHVGPLTLPNPVLTASGTSGLGTELAPWVDLASLGAVVTKSLSAEAWPGNPPPRLVPTAAGMLNSVGLHNPGVPAWTASYLPALAASGARVVVSIWAGTVDGYRRTAELVAAELVAAELVATAGDVAAPLGHMGASGGAVVAVEANISCPNVEDRSRMFAHDETAAAAAIAATVAGLAGSGLPVLAKLSPNVTDLPAVAAATVDAGAAGLTLVNTLMGLAIDPASGRARLGNGGGGLSGPALHPVAVRAVYECRAALPAIPIVGVGGITTGLDAAELIAAGADAVEVGSATFADPRAPARVLAELTAWCARHDIARIDQLRGRAHA